MWRFGSLEFMPAVKQAHKKAVCPFCNAWAPSDADGHGECKAKYGRHRAVAIFCRVVISDGVFRAPDAKELARATARAVKLKASPTRKLG